MANFIFHTDGVCRINLSVERHLMSIVVVAAVISSGDGGVIQRYVINDNVASIVQATIFIINHECVKSNIGDRG